MALWSALALGYDTRLLRDDGAGPCAHRRADDVVALVTGAFWASDMGNVLGLGREDDLPS